MRKWICTGIVLIGTIACSQEDASKSEHLFETSEWKAKEGYDYPHRELMLNDLLYNDTVRTLNEGEILELLGKPDRLSEGYFYYTVSQKRIGAWPIHTKSLVIKFENDSTIEWMKIHK